MQLVRVGMIGWLGKARLSGDGLIGVEYTFKSCLPMGLVVVTYKLLKLGCQAEVRVCD